MPRIILPQFKQVLDCPTGVNLYEYLAEHSLLDAPCGGRGACGKCMVEIDKAPVLSCTYEVNEDITVLLPTQTDISDIISAGFMKPFVPDKGQPETYGIAVDIGTTTVVAALYDLSDGTELATLSCLNGQKIYGQDVISRIHYALEHKQGTQLLQQRIVDDLNGLFTALIERCGLNTEQIGQVAVSGNTTMIHLLGGYNPSSLATAPYVPVFSGPLVCSAQDLQLKLRPDCSIYCLPAVSSFVGGDISAGVVACGIESQPGHTLFIDIGTNGEMVLASNGALSCCSCAAGPALEGMNISCGMRAATGAIEDVTLTASGQISCKTIGSTAPKGLCGSGLLSAISALRAIGVIGTNGRFAKHPLVEEHKGKKRVVLEPNAGIYLSQGDIRQVQLAKGAILSGVLTLLSSAELSVEMVDQVMVAGQFGAHLSVDSLIGCGILPQVWSHKITYTGNTAKSGAAICLLSSRERNRCAPIVQKIRYIELSTIPDYQQIFVQCLHF